MIIRIHVILRIISITAIIIILCFDASSQVTEDWIERYNGTANSSDRAVAIAVDASGYVYVTGESLTPGDNLDYCTIKYSSSGTRLLILKYNGPADSTDFATCIAIDNSGNIIVSGGSIGNDGSYDYCTIKYNNSGLVQWIQRYNGTTNGNDEVRKIAVDYSGNVYITGMSEGSGPGHDYCTIKYNSSGIQQWVKRYDGTANNNDGALSIAVDNSGNVYVTGDCMNTGTSFDYCTIKYNSSGVQQWVKIYNGPGNTNDNASSLALDNSGNIYVTGSSDGIGTYKDYCTIKYNSSGTQQWVQRYNGSDNFVDYANSITIDNSDNIYVTGTSTGASSSNDYCTIKYNSSGTQQWVKIYNGPANSLDAAYSINADSSDNVYITGYSFGLGTVDDYCTIKYSSSGTQRWVQRYNGPGNSTDKAFSVFVSNSGYVYITGESKGSGTDLDYCTIKYSQPIGIQNISNEIPSSFSLYQNYPNPFNPTTKIKFDITSNVKSELSGYPSLWENVQIVIYDLMGKEVTTLVNEQLKSGTYEVDWNAVNYTSGVYFYKLSIGDFNEMKKMIMLK
jgi:hypothetical protein